MLTDNLLDKVVLHPGIECDRLLAVSGYVSGSMAVRHVLGTNAVKLSRRRPELRIDLIYGIYPTEGVLRSDHKTFAEIFKQNPNFQVHFYQGDRPVHSKVYVWLKTGVPKVAFSGSANYSTGAFFGRTQEVMSEVDPGEALLYVQLLMENTVAASDSRTPRFRSRHLNPEAVDIDHEPKFSEAFLNLEYVDLPLFIVNTAQIHQKSGLNWRRRLGREANQAYIPIPASGSRTGFLPSDGTWFTVLTDDGESFECRTAQQGEKAIETPLNNSILGIYFRRRLGVPTNESVGMTDLARYGRDHVRFYKATNDVYFLDFQGETGWVG